MADDLRIQIQAELEKQLSTQNINADIISLEKKLSNIKLKVELDTNDINNINTQINALSKSIKPIDIKLNVDNNKASDIASSFSNQGTKAGKEFSNGFNKSVKFDTSNMTTLQKEMESYAKNMAKLNGFAVRDVKVNDNGVGTLKSANIEYYNDALKESVVQTYKLDKANTLYLANVKSSTNYQKQTEELNNSINKRKELIEQMKLYNIQAEKAGVKFNPDNQTKFSDLSNTANTSSQIKEMQHLIKLTRSEYDQLNASMTKDIPNTALENMKKNISSMPTNITNIETSLKRLQNPSDELKNKVNQLSTGFKELDNIQDSDKKVKHYSNLKDEITNTRNEVNSLIKVQGQQVSNLDKTKLSDTMTIWLNNNSKAAAEFGDKIRELQLALSTVDDKSGSMNINKEFQAVKKSADAMGLTGRTFADEMKNNISKFAGWFGISQVVMTGVNALKTASREMINNVKELDKVHVDLQQATGKTREEVGKLIDTYYDLGQELGANAIDIAKSSADWLRQGKSIADTNILIKDSMILSKIGQIDSAQATTYLTSVMKAYGVSAKDVIGIVDKLSAVDMVSATDVGGLAEGMNAVSASAKLAGISMDKLLGYLAVIGETTGESMSSVGTSLNAMFARMGNIKLSRLKDYQNGGEDLSNTETVLKGLDIKLRDSKDTFRDFGDVLDEVAGRWSGFTEVEQRAIASSIAGTNHLNSFIVLMESYGTSLDYTQTSLESSGNAMEKFGAYSESIEAKTERLKNSFIQLSETTINSDFIKGFFDLANGVVQATNAVGGLVPVLGVLGGAFAIHKFLIPALVKSMGALLLAETGVTATTMSQIVAMTGLNGAMALGTTVTSTFISTILPLVGVAALITGLVMAYDHFNVTLEENQEALSKLKGEYDSTTSEVKSLEDQIASVQSKMKEMEKINPLSFVEDNEYQKLSDSNDQLNRRLIIEKELQKIAAKDAEEKAIETIDQKSEDSIVNVKTTHSDYFGTSVKAEKITRDDAIEERINKYNELAKSVDEIITQQSLLDLSNKKDLKTYSDLEDQKTLYNETMEDHYAYILNTMRALDSESESIVGATKNGEQYTTTIKTLGDYVEDFIAGLTQAPESIDEVSDAMSNANEEIAGFDVSIYKQQIDELQTSLSSLSSAQEKLAKGNLSSSEVLDLLQEFPQLIPYVDMAAEGFGDLSKGLTEVATIRTDGLVSDLTSIRDTLSGTDKIALDTAINALKKMSEESTTASSGVLSLSDALSALVANAKLVDTIKEEVKEFGYITSSTLSDITSKYPQLTNVVADYLNGLASTKDVLAGLKTAYDNDFKNYENTVIEKKKLDVDFYNTVVKNLSNDIREKAKAYGIDFDNYKNLQEAKLALDKKYARQVYILESAKMASQKANDIASTSGNLRDQGNALGYVDNYIEAESNLQKLQEVIDGFNTTLSGSLNLSDYKGLNGEPDKPKKDKKEFSKVFDWFSIRIDKLKEKAQSTIDSIAKYTSYKTKNSKIDIAVQTKVDQSKSLKDIQDSYNDLAKKVKLPKKYRDLVNNGGMDIQTITNETLAKQIEEYTQLRDAAKAVGKSIEEINAEIKELQSQKLDNIKSYFDSKSSTTESRISKRESSISLKEAQGKSGTKGDYQYLINRQNVLKANAKSEYDAYKSTFDDLVKLGSKNGGINVGDAKWKESTSYLLELETQINNCDISIQGFNDSITNLPVEKLQNKIKSLDASQQKIEDSISLKESKGGTASKSDYTSLISFSETKIATIKKENAEHKKGQKGLKDTDAGYIALQEKIDANLSSINACKIAQVNWNAEIRDLTWVAFDKAIDKLKLVKDNLSTISSLISGDLVNKDGNFTDSGITQLGIYAQQISSARNEVSLYAGAISKLKTELANGTISQKQYDEELANNISLQNQAAVSIKEYEKSIIELNKKAIETQTDEMKKLIQARKDELSAQKASDDYAKKVKKSQDGIDVIKKKIAALALSTDRKDIAQRLALEKDLKEKESELTEMHTDHDYDTKVKALDDELKSYEKTQEAKLKALDNNLTTQQLAIKDSLSLVKDNYNTVLSGINTLASTYGVELADSITSPWTSATNAAQIYKDLIASMRISDLDINNIGNSVSIGAGLGIGSGDNSNKSKIETLLGKANGSGKGTSKLNEYVKGLGYNQLSYSNMADLGNILGIKGVTAKNIEGDTETKLKILDALKKAGFKNGGYIESGDLNSVVRSNGDNVLMTGKVGEAVFKAEEVQMIKALTTQIPTMSNLIDHKTNFGSIKPRENNISIHYDTLLNVEGSIDKSFDFKPMIDTAIDKNNSTILKVFKQNGIK